MSAPATVGGFFRSSIVGATVLCGLAASGAALAQQVDRDSVGGGTLLRCTGDGLVPLPALSVEVAVDVTGIMLRGTVTEAFVNPTDQVIEARYLFPLPENAAVDFMEMRIGDRRISSIIQERAEARATYEQAKAAGKKAALLDERRPNLFEASVAGIAPGETVTVELRYLEEVAFRDGGFRIVFPLTLTPRYSRGPGTTRVAAPPAATLAVRIDAGFPIDSIRSSSHEIQVERQGRIIVVRPRREPVAADRDFILDYRPQDSEEPVASIVTEDRDDGRYALLTMLPPPATAEPEGLPTDTTFIIDVSGSMEGPSITSAQEALLAALDRLRPGDRFNLLKFSDVSEPFRAESLPADDRSVAAARAWVRSLEASGGTEIVAALVRGMKMMDGGNGSAARRIILITDGAVDDEAEAFRAVSGQMGDLRLHVLGIGRAPNRYLLKKLAQFGHGSWEFIADTGEAGERVQRFLARIDRPVLTHVRLDWDGAPPEEAYPDRVPDLYAGEPLLVSLKLGIAHPGTRAVLSGDGPGGFFVREFEVGDGAPAGAGIATRWARAKVEALLDGLHEGADPGEVRPRVIELAREFHLVTRFTSFVAVEEEVTADTGELPQGGTGGPLRLRIGLALALFGSSLWVCVSRMRT